MRSLRTEHTEAIYTATGVARSFGPVSSRWIVSVDLGQSIDHTAVSVLEVVTREMIHNRYWMLGDDERERADPPSPSYYDASGKIEHPKYPALIAIRHLERLPLGMSYVDQISHIGRLLHRSPLDAHRPELLFDQTGVGRPVIDLARRAGLRPIAITITSGHDEKIVETGRKEEWHVAKLLLISRLQSVLHEGILRAAPRLKEARTLLSELEDFRIGITASGNATFGARVGAHDDVVLATAMGCWRAARDRGVASVRTLRI